MRLFHPFQDMLPENDRMQAMYDEEFIKTTAVAFGRDPFENIAAIDKFQELVNEAIGNSSQLHLLLQLFRNSHFHLFLCIALWRTGKYLTQPRITNGPLFAIKAIRLISILAAHDYDVRADLVAQDKLFESIVYPNMKIAKGNRDLTIELLKLFKLYVTDDDFAIENNWRKYMSEKKFAAYIVHMGEVCNMHSDDEEIMMSLLNIISNAHHDDDLFNMFNNSFIKIMDESWTYLIKDHYTSLYGCHWRQMEVTVRTKKRENPESQQQVTNVMETDYRHAIKHLKTAYNNHFIRKHIKQEQS